MERKPNYAMRDSWAQLQKKQKRQADAIISKRDYELDNILDKAASDAYADGPSGRGASHRGSFLVSAPFLKTVINGVVVKE